MTNTNVPMLEWCEKRIGGKIYKRKKYEAHWKDKYEWMSWGDKDTLLFTLKNLQPYIVAKSEQIKVMIRFAKTFSGTRKRLTKAERAKRRQCYRAIKKLNGRGLATTE